MFKSIGRTISSLDRLEDLSPDVRASGKIPVSSVCTSATPEGLPNESGTPQRTNHRFFAGEWQG
jgi:hypothetical protein